MMESMIKQEGISFKELEQEIFRKVCELGREATVKILEEYDRYLKENRNKKAYRNKGLRQTTVKTVYGEVTYTRTVYETMDEYGTKRYVYLLDETLELENVGLISENYASMLVAEVTEMSYRACAEKASQMTGQSISAMGVWNVIQALGKKVCDEEKELVKAHKEGLVKGKRVAPVLFEEADGVWLFLQGKDRQKNGFDKAEMKVSIAYDGWKDKGGQRYELDGKVSSAGFEKGKDFQKAREALIASEYDLEQTDLRLLNGDGAQWIRNTVDKSTVFQLDPFHRNKAIRENIKDGKARNDIHKYLGECDIDGLFNYLEMYRDSLSEDEWIEKAKALISYFQSNRDGLLPYQKMDLTIPESPEGLCYRNMGTMENHVCSIIAHRMKGRRCSWSTKGGNHLAKILAKKQMGRLYEVTERLKKPLFEKKKVEEIEYKILTAGMIAKKVGKGYSYPVMGHLPVLDKAITGDGRKNLTMAGF